MIDLLLLSLGEQVFLDLVCELLVLFFFVLELMSVLGFLACQLNHSFVQIVPLCDYFTLLLIANFKLVLV